MWNKFFRKHAVSLVLAVFTIIISVLLSVYISTRYLASYRNTHIDYAILHTSMGDIKMKFADDAPRTTENFIKLTRQGLYDNTRFHRVIDGLLVQGGDPLSKFVSAKSQWGKGGPGYTFPDEIDKDKKMVRGVVAMANSGVDTNGSQFFILVKDADWLNGQHTIFAEVTEGMDVVDNISSTPTGPTNIPHVDIDIKSVSLE